MSTQDKHIDIYNLITKKLDGDITQEELQSLNDLILIPENKKIYDDLTQIWSADIDNSINVDVAAAFEKVEKRFEANKKGKVIPFKFLYAAAAIIVLVLVSTYFIRLNTQTNVSNNEIASVTKPLVTPNVKKLEFVESVNVLQDSSVVDLNKNSKIVYSSNFGETTREVELEGEAFFTVTSDTSKPFIIHTPEIDVKVLGTSFFVNATPGSPVVDVVVKTGKVWVNSKNNKEGVVLTAGQKIRYNTETKNFEDFDLDENKLFWKTKRLRFRRIKMQEVAKEIENLYNVTIVLDKKSKSLPLNSTFENKTIEEVLEIIKLTLDITYRIEDSTIYINAKENGK